MNKLSLRRKVEVLTHYGNGRLACRRCGERDLDCLSIDHIVASPDKHGYAWFISHNYPEGYQTLCMNCQFKKRVENKELQGHRNVDLTKRGRNSVVVAIRIHKNTYTIVKEMADKKGVSVSAFIKSKVEEYARLAGETVNTTKPVEYVVIGGRRFKKQ